MHMHSLVGLTFQHIIDKTFLTAVYTKSKNNTVTL